MNISETKTVYIVWTNTDKTEGRGLEYPLFVCEKQATAERLGKGQGVQGSNCTITEDKAYKIDGCWYVAGRIVGPSRDDRKKQQKMDERREIKDKMLEAGFSIEEINKLQG